MNHFRPAQRDVQARFSVRRAFFAPRGENFLRTFLTSMQKKSQKVEKVFHILKTRSMVVENCAAGGIPNWRISKHAALLCGRNVIFLWFCAWKK
jgi:hypothetical protein